MLIWFWIVGLLGLGFAFWLLNFVSLPGNWCIVGLLAIYAWIGPATVPRDLDWPVLIAGITLALLGETVEFATAALGARQAGGSSRSAWAAMAGSLLGSVVGAMAGIPVPIIGPVIGAVLFAGIGAMIGAILGERSIGKPWQETVPVGHAAFWGRLIGMAGKIACGLGILVAIIVGLVG